MEILKGEYIMFAPKKILVPTDFSKFSDAALKKAVDIAEQHGSKIYLLHVIAEHVQQCAADYCLSGEVVKQLEKDSLKASKEKLKGETDTIVKSKKIDVSYDVKTGNPSEVILAEEKAKKIDLIVIASHGKTGILKQLMGSVSRNVLKGSKSTVMLVKP
jgi:nucleotide-binding universal stress UspA family protein